MLLQPFTALTILTLCADVTFGNAHNRVKRIIGGEEIDQSQALFMVSMQGEVVTRRILGIAVSHRHLYCGGTIINDRWILTAAHCFSNGANPSDWHARIASKNIRRSLGEGLLHIFGKIFNRIDWQQLEYHLERIVLHPSYVAGGKWVNDIALIKLRETIPHSGNEDRLGVIDLAKPEDVIEGVNCTVFGWGCPAVGSTMTSTMMKATLTLRSDRHCSNIWSVSTSTKLCAGGTNGQRESACSGDSGGPLICDTNVGKRQVGVVSFVEGTNPANFPVVFTRVSAYSRWINDTIR